MAATILPEANVLTKAHRAAVNMIARRVFDSRAGF